MIDDRLSLPQLEHRPFLTDSGPETKLIFIDGIELDEGDPYELASEYASLVARFPDLTILGGCCGTDERHIEQIASACITSAWPRTARA
jgi:S-methylmethionine-dependent homocysteine/selenocysteine methylase